MDQKKRQLAGKLDKATFEELFRDYFVPLCSFAQKYIGDPDEAKDIIHHVFIGLWQKREEVDLSTSLKSYLFTGVHNRCLNFIRDRKKLVHYDAPQHESELGDYLESRDFLEASETEAKINRALDALPEKCREIFMMSRFDQMKYKEIAEKLDISIKTVETQMSRALKVLREKLSDLITVLILYILNNL